MPAMLLKRDSNRCFPVKFAKFLGTPILKNFLRTTASEMDYIRITEIISLEIFTRRKLSSFIIYSPNRENKFLRKSGKLTEP